MTNEQAKKMLKAKLECLKRETSGTDFDCNNSNCDECSLCYEKGHMGEQIEALEMAIKVLESKTKIVTCKDCKHGRNGICPNYRDFVDEDFYCASAERCYK